MKINKNIDAAIIKFSNRAYEPVARGAIFVVYFWFGMLKVLGLSPAEPLVHDLFNHTLGFMMSFDTFYVLFSLLEVIIGIMFLLPFLTRFVMALLFAHLFTTVLPLIFLPEATWQTFLVPTLVGQYIIKNVLIVACAIGIAGHLQLRKKKY